MALYKKGVFVPILPEKEIDVMAMGRAVKETLKMMAEGAKADFKVTTKTWEGQPEFIVEEKRGGFTIDVYTTNPIYGYITHGTRVRYATMSKDFKPKSRIHYIGSNKGKGGVVFISKKNPRPGIKAREFDEVIAIKWNKRMSTIFRRAVDVQLFMKRAKRGGVLAP